MLSQRDTVGGGTTQEWHVEIVTPEGEALHPQATLVELSTPNGQIGVMPGHERLVTVLDVGELVIHNGRQRDVYLVGGGFARVQAERLSVLAFSLDCATDSAAMEKCRARRCDLVGDGETDPICDGFDENPIRSRSAMDSPRMV